MRRSVLITSASPAARLAQGRAHMGADPGVVLDTATLPFVRPSVDLAPPGSTLLLIDIDRAFPIGQSGGTRLVLTQSTYTLQKWIDHLGPGGRIVATADRRALELHAAEAFQARGPWNTFEIIELEQNGHEGPIGIRPSEGADLRAGPAEGGHTGPALLARAYASSSPTDRLALCRDAVTLAPECAVAYLALASACRETNDMPGARTALDRALELAPDWEAAHFEDGKLWLASDDMERARDAFQRACDLMPTFSAAFSNLGATLGELDEPERALAAFRQALATDPRGFQTWNNVGVVSRELGRFDESEAAFRHAIDLAPDFVFGYYNLGHTLFLAGNLPSALASYEEGQRRDPEKNRRQGCRLAMMRLANGDADGAARDFWHFVNQAPPGEREDLLLEAYEIAQAILASIPGAAAHRGLVDQIGREIAQ